jgi:proline dehydrogenase
MSLFNTLIRTSLPVTPKPLIRFFAKRYVAGTTIEDAVSTVKRLQQEGCCATMDVLGESVTSRELAHSAVELYLQVLDAIEEHSLDANVSLKPTQMGLTIDEAFCLECIGTIVEKASARKIFVRIDMEDSPTTDATLRVFRKLDERFPRGSGVVLQSRLRRTLQDAVDLARDQVNVRLCKGIYLEPRPIGYMESDIIRNNFMHVLEVLFAGGSYVGVATQDEWLVCETIAMANRMGVTGSGYEFQMLLGVDPELRRILTTAGHRLRVYVPFGSHWYPYSVRRLRENPTIARAGLEAFLRGRVES